MKFAKAYDKTLDVKQSFDLKKMNYKKGDGEYNRFDEIQEANVDCNIYEVLEKYNLQPDVMTAAKLYKDLGHLEGVMADITEIQELGSMGEIHQYTIRAKEAFENLPIEVRKEFDNDYGKFVKNGAKFIQSKINAIKKPEPAPETTPEPKGDK